MEPGPGEEYVRDYQCPPRMEDVDVKVKAVFGGVTLACTTRAKRVLESGQPPVYYVPPEDVRMEHLELSGETSHCECKGQARYYDVVARERAEENAAWSYQDPTRSFESLKGYVAFHPSKMDACWVDGEKVEAWEGDFRGAWITAGIAGPFKDAPVTCSW